MAERDTMTRKAILERVARGELRAAEARELLRRASGPEDRAPELVVATSRWIGSDVPDGSCRIAFITVLPARNSSAIRADVQE